MSEAAKKLGVQGAAVPEGYEDYSGDIEAFWEPYSEPTRKRDAREGSPPILFTPLYLTLMDSQIEEGKSTTLLHGRLEAPAVLRAAGQKGEEPRYEEFEAGTQIGIWTKAGMAKLKKLANVKVHLANTGEVREIAGKPSPMVLFSIKVPKGAKGEPLRVFEDRRKDSLPDEVKQKRAKAAETRSKEAADFDMDDVPF